jgi:TonB-linked SusC/RagA family outer membrane protein
MLTANFRRDGSSKFGKGNKWGTFPSASLAWRVSDEPFMKGIDQISNLKLRTSYGVVGNDAPVSAYSYISGLSSGQDYTFNNLPKVSGVTVTGFNNPNITWETVKQFDIGLDIGLFRGAVEATFDYFNKKTEDMLVAYPIPGSSGSFSSINKNVGQILNRGFEFSATVRKKVGEFDISVTGNLTSLHNEITSLGGAPPWMSGAVEFGNCTRMEEGQQVGAFYGYKMLDVFDTQEDVTNYVKPGTTTIIQPGAKAGDVKWADLDNSGSITPADRYIMGNPIPTLTYGLSANLSYKGFDLSLFFQGVSGHDIYAELVCWTEGMHTNFNTGTQVLDRWTPDNTTASIPRAVRNDPNGNIKNISDRYIKDGDYFRLKNASLGYTLPKSATDFIKLSSLRLYVTGRNLFTITNYPFYDPEIGSGAVGTAGSVNQNRGIDNGYYPQARTFILGIQVDF